MEVMCTVRHSLGNDDDGEVDVITFDGKGYRGNHVLQDGGVEVEPSENPLLQKQKTANIQHQSEN